MRAIASYLFAGLVFVSSFGLAFSQSVDWREEQRILAQTNALRSRAVLLQLGGKAAEAEALLLKALELVELNFGSRHQDYPFYLSALGDFYKADGRLAVAESYYRRAIERDVNGGTTSSVLPSTINLAESLRQQGNTPEAGRLYRHALEIWNRSGTDQSQLQSILYGLARTQYQQRDWAGAVDSWTKGTDATIKVALASSKFQKESLWRDDSDFGIAPSAAEFQGLIKAAFRSAEQNRNQERSLANTAFVGAQYLVNPLAARAYSKMVVRAAEKNPEWSDLIRERQDILERWQRNARAGHNVSAENRLTMEALDKRLTDLDRRLDVRFPVLAEAMRPLAFNISDVQRALDENELLVFVLSTGDFVSTPEETFVWVVGKREVRWTRSNVGSDAIANEVFALRCGLDYASWRVEPRRCSDLTGVNYSQKDREAGVKLPFDTSRANRLFDTLFGQVGSLFAGKRLLVVTTGPLSQLPLHVLVTQRPSAGREVAWMARQNAIAVVPSISVLLQSRTGMVASMATKPVIGFGNPWLDGRPDHATLGEYYRQQSQLARRLQDCEQAVTASGLAMLENRGLVSSDIRRAVVDGNELRQQPALPETAHELCEVARLLNADVSEVRLGQRATESELKSLSGTGALAQYRILHFATHGVAAGALRGDQEPGLILTPPDNPTSQDDGYLSSSEIAALRLDADIVILSACNTASGNEPSAEALSGLARAFFYAQARSLLVTHWSIDSSAATRFIVKAISQLGNGDLAEASKQTMLAMIADTTSHESQPEYWAAFALISGMPMRR